MEQYYLSIVTANRYSVYEHDGLDWLIPVNGGW